MWLWADFNAVEDDTVWTSVRRTEGVGEDELEEGQRIELRDHEGNACWGTITETSGPIVYLELDWSTWTTEQDQVVGVLQSFTKSKPSTGTFFGFGFEVTERFRGARIDLTHAKQTGELQHQ